MKIISSRKTIDELMAPLIKLHSERPGSLAENFAAAFLYSKIRFPLLEYAAAVISSVIELKDQIEFLDEVMSHRTIGGNVIAGKILQQRLNSEFKESFAKAEEYIISGSEWFVTDIIGERVMGFALLTQPESTIPVLKKYAKHKHPMIVRTIGAAAHYAVKKGLQKNYTDEMLQLLLTLSSSKDYHIKTGTGWGAKTCVKFYPELAELYSSEINSEETGGWFKAKIKTGLGRAYKYAGRYNR